MSEHVDNFHLSSTSNKVSPRKFVYIYYSACYRKSIHIFWDSLYLWIYVQVFSIGYYFYLRAISSSSNFDPKFLSGRGGMAIVAPNFLSNCSYSQSNLLYLLKTWILLKLGVTGYSTKFFIPPNFFPFFGSPILQVKGSCCKGAQLKKSYK